MKTLYISDMDGTLLLPSAEISEYTKAALNSLIASGMLFSVATARTAATALKMLDGVNINMPVVLMNGVCTYDMRRGCYTHVSALSDEAKRALLDTVRENGLSGFVYTIDGGELHTFYASTDTPNAVKFMEERIIRFGKKFTKVDSLERCFDKNIVYYSISDKEEKLRAAVGAMSEYKELLHCEFYRDNYNEGYHYFEVSSAAASKYNAVRALRKEYKLEKIVGFGDNRNDISLFEACDETYAVQNAVPELKKRANAVIGSNGDDGVARWLVENQNKM